MSIRFLSDAHVFLAATIISDDSGGQQKFGQIIYI